MIHTAPTRATYGVQGESKMIQLLRVTYGVQEESNMIQQRAPERVTYSVQEESNMIQLLRELLTVSRGRLT